MGQITYKFDELSLPIAIGADTFKVLVSGSAEIEFSSFNSWDVSSVALEGWEGREDSTPLCECVERSLRSDLISDIEDEIDAAQDAIRCRAYDREIA